MPKKGMKGEKRTAKNGKKYVVYGLRAKGSQGTMENYLTTETGH